MIAFDPSKIVTKHMYVKTVSGALGGTLTVLDEKRSKAAGKEVFTKIKIAHQLTRHWSKKHRGMNKYLKPVLTAVTFYENHIVCLERHPLGNLGKETTEGLFGEVKWVSDSEANIKDRLSPLMLDGNWYIDGTYIYHVDKADLNGAERLSADGKFRQVSVKAIKLAKLGDIPDVEERVCLAFYPKNGDMSLTPPIWKTLTNIGQRQLSARGAHLSERDVDTDDIDDGVTYIGTEAQRTQFDQIDQMLCVNLGFALKAGRELSQVFGYDSIEPIGLDDLMIQLRTVNLPNVANEVKQTFDIGLSFTIAIAWLIGLTRRTESLDSYITLRSLLKYLTTKGVYRKGAFNPDSIFRAGSDLDDIPMMSLSQAKAKAKSLTVDAFLKAARLAREAEGLEGGLPVEETTAEIAARMEAQE